MTIGSLLWTREHCSPWRGRRDGRSRGQSFVYRRPGPLSSPKVQPSHFQVHRLYSQVSQQGAAPGHSTTTCCNKWTIPLFNSYLAKHPRKQRWELKDQLRPNLALSPKFWRLFFSFQEKISNIILGGSPGGQTGWKESCLGWSKGGHLPPLLAISSPNCLWALTQSLKAQQSTTGNPRSVDEVQMARYMPWTGQTEEETGVTQNTWSDKEKSSIILLIAKDLHQFAKVSLMAFFFNDRRFAKVSSPQKNHNFPISPFEKNQLKLGKCESKPQDTTPGPLEELVFKT